MSDLAYRCNKCFGVYETEDEAGGCCPDITVVDADTHKPIIQLSFLSDGVPNERCIVCGCDLGTDNRYGDDDFPLCRFHHSAYTFALTWVSADNPTPITQQMMRAFA